MAGSNQAIQSTQTTGAVDAIQSPPSVATENETAVKVEHTRYNVINGDTNLEFHPSTTTLTKESLDKLGSGASFALTLQNPVKVSNANGENAVITHVLCRPVSCDIHDMERPWPFRIKRTETFFQQHACDLSMSFDGVSIDCVIALNHAAGKPLATWSEFKMFVSAAGAETSTTAAEKMLAFIRDKLPECDVQMFDLSLLPVPVEPFVDQLGFQFILMQGAHATAFRQFDNGHWGEIPAAPDSLDLKHGQRWIGNDNALCALILTRIEAAHLKSEPLCAFSWVPPATPGDLVRRVFTTNDFLPEFMPMVLPHLIPGIIFDAVVEGPSQYGMYRYSRDNETPKESLDRILNGVLEKLAPRLELASALLHELPTTEPDRPHPSAGVHLSTRRALLDLGKESHSTGLSLWQRRLLDIHCTDSYTEAHDTLDWFSERIGPNADAEAREKMLACLPGNGSPTGKVHADIVVGLIAAIPWMISIDMHTGSVRSEEQPGLSARITSMVTDAMSRLEPESVNKVCEALLRTSARICNWFIQEYWSVNPPDFLTDLLFKADDISDFALDLLIQRRNQTPNSLGGAFARCSADEEVPILKALTRALPSWRNHLQNLSDNVSTQINQVTGKYVSYLVTVMPLLSAPCHDKVLEALLHSLPPHMDQNQVAVERVVSDALQRIDDSKVPARISQAYNAKITALQSGFNNRQMGTQFMQSIERRVNDLQLSANKNGADNSESRDLIRGTAFLWAYKASPVSSMNETWKNAIQKHGGRCMYKAFTDCLTAFHPSLIQNQLRDAQNHSAFLDEIERGTMLLRLTGTRQERFVLLEKLVKSMPPGNFLPVQHWPSVRSRIVRLTLSNPKVVSAAQYASLIARVLTKVPVKNIEFPATLSSGTLTNPRTQRIRQGGTSRVKQAIESAPARELGSVLKMMTSLLRTDQERVKIFLDVANARIDKIPLSEVGDILCEVIRSRMVTAGGTIEDPVPVLRLVQRGIDRLEAGGFRDQCDAILFAFRLRLMLSDDPLVFKMFADDLDCVPDAMRKIWFEEAVDFVSTSKEERHSSFPLDNFNPVKSIAGGIAECFPELTNEKREDILARLAEKFDKDGSMFSLMAFALAMEPLPMAMQEIWVGKAIDVLATCDAARLQLLCERQAGRVNCIGSTLGMYFNRLEPDPGQSGLLDKFRSKLKTAATPYPFAACAVALNRLPEAMRHVWFETAAPFINRTDADSMRQFEDVTNTLKAGMVTYLKSISNPQERMRRLALVTNPQHLEFLNSRLDRRG